MRRDAHSRLPRFARFRSLHRPGTRSGANLMNIANRSRLRAGTVRVAGMRQTLTYVGNRP